MGRGAALGVIGGLGPHDAICEGAVLAAMMGLVLTVCDRRCRLLGPLRNSRRRIPDMRRCLFLGLRSAQSGALRDMRRHPFLDRKALGAVHRPACAGAHSGNCEPLRAVLCPTYAGATSFCREGALHPRPLAQWHSSRTPEAAGEALQPAAPVALSAARLLALPGRRTPPPLRAAPRPSVLSTPIRPDAVPPPLVFQWVGGIPGCRCRRGP